MKSLSESLNEGLFGGSKHVAPVVSAIAVTRLQIGDDAVVMRLIKDKKKPQVDYIYGTVKELNLLTFEFAYRIDIDWKKSRLSKKSNEDIVKYPDWWKKGLYITVPKHDTPMNGDRWKVWDNDKRNWYYVNSDRRADKGVITLIAVDDDGLDEGIEKIKKDFPEYSKIL